ncbi:MarR family transcriptional regulator [Sulfolobus sp. E5-1-F]|uniref:MarR family transcriptional regulator n=1 Tax=Saccharolobus sp. E5-1-F TaxID=2663019 RepID=UPI0012961D64|nr:MarR family transcriptional regulator [Sulfolobus sp. E5-1-F]QGA54840.1 MarR family transcriptional regulator [Sulfolobus sp. E5-1-F]
MNSKDKVISILKEKGSLPQSELGKLSGLSKSRLSEVLSELEKEGIIKRRKVLGKNLEVSLSQDRFLRLGIIRAAEYPFIIPFIKNLENRGYNVTVKIYENGIDLTKDLVEAKLDLGLSPIITQMIFLTIYRNIRIIGGGAKGGGGIIGKTCTRIASTVMSSMEMWAFREFRNIEIIPSYSSYQMLDFLEKGVVDGIAIWEPFLSILERKGYKVHRFTPLHCCTLAVRDNMDWEKIRGIYEESFSWFKSSMDRWISSYSNLLNIDYNILKEASKNYEFDYYLDLNEFKNTLKNTGIFVPI